MYLLRLAANTLETQVHQKPQSFCQASSFFFRMHALSQADPAGPAQAFKHRRDVDTREALINPLAPWPQILKRARGNEFLLVERVGKGGVREPNVKKVKDTHFRRRSASPFQVSIKIEKATHSVGPS